MHSYKPARIDLDQKQIHKLAQFKPVRIKFEQLGKGSYVILLHPVNHKSLSQAHSKGKGATLQLAPGEVYATQQSQLGGTGFFDFLKPVWNFVKGNATPLLDIAQNVARPFVGDDIADGGRELVRNITGKGMKPVTARARRACGNGLYV